LGFGAILGLLGGKRFKFYGKGARFLRITSLNKGMHPTASGRG